MHGVSPDQHGLTNRKASEETFPDDSLYPSVFRVVREADPKAELASFCAWKPINSGIIESNIDVHKVSMPDRELAHAAAEYISEHPDLRLMFLAFDLPDAEGHRHGYNTREQMASITETDELIGIVLRAIERAGMMDDSLIIMVSDHGGGGVNTHDHGSDHPMDQTIFWGCTGPGVRPGSGIAGGITITDTAAVVLRVIGLEAPPTWEAEVPSARGFRVE